MDKNYWKEAYKEYWEISSKKEIFVKELIESKTGFKNAGSRPRSRKRRFSIGERIRLWFNKRRRRFICNTRWLN